jgi:hypothetical protein
MEGENSPNKRIELLYFIAFLFTGISVFAVSFITGSDIDKILRNTIASLIMAGCVIFMVADACKRGTSGFLFDNSIKKSRFFIAYFISIALACLFSFIPSVFWPYMSLFVILSLMSNCEIGMICGTCLAMISVMLEQGGDYSELFMYVIAGAIAIALFRDLKEDTSIALPIFICLMIQAVLLTAFYLLFQNRRISPGMLIMPAFNLLINLMILLIFLNMFGVYVIRKTNDMYIEINDTEFHLLVSLKEKNKDEYFRAIHTAYLAERLAFALSLNARAVKTCSYYHRIGTAENKTGWEQIEHYYTDNNFPDEAIELLHEYTDPAYKKTKSAEALLVLMSETVVATIMHLLKQNKNAKIDYEKLIDTIFENKEKKGELKVYEVTFKDYETMRKLLKKEKLYYDFLH